jgi:hypothetical protein
MLTIFFPSPAHLRELGVHFVYQMPELPIWRYVNLDCEQVKVML